MSKYVPMRRKKSAQHNPWITREIIHLKRSISRKRKVRSASREHLRLLTDKLKTMIRHERDKFYNITLNNFVQTCPQKFWRFLSGNKNLIDQIKTSQNVTSSPTEIANEFNQTFQNVFSRYSVSLPTGELPTAQLVMDEPVLSIGGILNLLLNIDVKNPLAPMTFLTSF